MTSLNPTLNTKRPLPNQFSHDFEFQSSTKRKTHSKGYKTMKDENYDLYDFSSLSSNKTTESTSISDTHSNQQFFGLYDYNDYAKACLMSGSLDASGRTSSLEGSSHITMEKLISDQVRTEDCIDLEMPEAPEPIQGNLNQLNGDDDLFKQNQIVPIHKAVELSQTKVPVAKTFKEPNPHGCGLGLDGDHQEGNSVSIFDYKMEVETNLFSSVSFPITIKSRFDLPSLNSNPSSQPKKNDYMTKLASKRAIEEQKMASESTSEKAQELRHKGRKQGIQQAYLSLGGNKGASGRENKVVDQKTKHQSSKTYQNSDSVPVFMNTTLPFIETFRQSECDRVPSIMHGIPAGKELGRLFEDTKEEQSDMPLLPFVANIAPQENAGLDNKEATTLKTMKKSQSDSDFSQYSSNSTADSRSFDPRPDKNYVRSFTSGLIILVKEGQIGQFLDTWKGKEIKTKNEIIADLEKNLKGKKTKRDLKAAAVFDRNINPDQEITLVTSPECVLKVARIKLVKEFFMEENYAWWVYNVFSPFKKGSGDENAKTYKKNVILSMRVALYKRVLSCFR